MRRCRLLTATHTTRHGRRSAQTRLLRWVPNVSSASWQNLDLCLLVCCSRITFICISVQGSQASVLRACAMSATCLLCRGAYSDKHGRKSTAYISLITTAVTCVAFGLARNYWLAVALRGINGLCDFMLGTTKMLITELVEPAHQPRAMSYLGACWGTAVIVGPSVGGCQFIRSHRFP